MSNRLIVNNGLNPIRNGNNKKNINKDKNKADLSFAKVFQKKLEENSEVKFSKHAQNRLVSRDINLSDKDLSQLVTGVKKAEEKGAKDSLIMVNNIAYVVSIQNKTVVTAVDNSSIDERIFTKIDSAVFME